MGGHVRVGFEDNIYYRKRRACNIQRPIGGTHCVQIAKEVDRPVATPDEAREILGIKR